MRYLKRIVAKHNMRKAGYKKLFKKIGGRSIFAERWKGFIV